MIAQLKGVIDHIASDHVLIDVQGVGYQVFCSGRTLTGVGQGQAATLKILTHVREDHIHLYGFADELEKQWFDILLGVQGVGPKMALSILSQMGPSDLANALVLEDKRPFQAVSGVGPKVATRLVTELKQKIPKDQDTGTVPPPTTDSGESASGASAPLAESSLAGSAALMRDLISALVNLGYDEGRARSAAKTALADTGKDGGDADFNALIPLALKALSR